MEFAFELDWSPGRLLGGEEDLAALFHTLSLWQETLGTKFKKIQVREGEETKVEFKLVK